jgi:hypothetical protein
MYRPAPVDAEFAVDATVDDRGADAEADAPVT